MAIKKSQIPPPSDIKTSSSSFNEQELNSIKDLKNKINQLVVQFGQLYLSKNQIEEKVEDN